MKILIVMNDYFNKSNGMCISTQRFVASMRDFGHEVRICANDKNGTPDYPLNVLHIPIFDRIITKEGFTFSKIDRATLKEAVSWADIVHVEDPFLICTEACKLAKSMNKPVTGTFHIYPENMTYSVYLGKSNFFNTLFMLYFKHMVYNKCDAVMCPSSAVTKRLKRYFFHPKLYTISNGIKDKIVDYGSSHQDIRANHKENDKFQIITVGRYSKEKNQKLLLQALKKSKHLDQIELIVAGKGPLEKQLKQLANELPCKVTFGFYTQTELIHEMLRSDLYVHCADIEIEGMSCMEAFACGTVPLISNAKLSSTKSFALTKDNLFEARNADDMAKKIDYFIEHPEILTLLRKKYLDLANQLRVSESTKQLLEMMENCLYESNH